jgi:hypothetical protein
MRVKIQMGYGVRLDTRDNGVGNTLFDSSIENSSNSNRNTTFQILD